MVNKKNLRKIIIDTYPDDEQIYFAKGFDDAIIGIEEDTMRVVYSCKKAIQIIYNDTPMKKSDLDKDEIESGVTVREKRMEQAIEHFEFNVRGSKGEKLPIWVDDDFE